MAQKFRLKYGYETVLFYLAFFLGMLFLNFTMDSYEPFSLALLVAALACGLPALPMAGLFLLAGGISLLAATSSNRRPRTSGETSSLSSK